MMTFEESTKIVNLMTPGARVLVLRHGHIVKCIIYLKNLLYSQAQIRQTMYIVIMNKEGSTKIVTCMTPGAGGSCARVQPYKLYSEIYYFFKNLLLYSQAQGRHTKYGVIIDWMVNAQFNLTILNRASALFFPKFNRKQSG